MLGVPRSLVSSFLMLFVSACVSASSQNVTAVELAKVSATTMKEAVEISEIYEAGRMTVGRQLSVADLFATPYFKDSEAYLQRYLNAEGPKALAIAHPARCMGSYWVGKYASEGAAIVGALDKCMDWNKKYSRFAGTTCGCRLAFVGDRMTVALSTFEERYAAAFIKVYHDPLSNRPGESYYATALLPDSTGEDLPVRLEAAKGSLLCEGRFSFSRAGNYEGGGNFDVGCNGDLGRVKGKLSLENPGGQANMFRGKGVAEDGSRVEFILGRWSKEFANAIYLMNLR